MVAGSKKGCGCPSSCSCKKSPAQFNSKLQSAAAEGKLDDNPGFKAAVENAPKAVSKMWGPAKRKYGADAVAKKRGCGMKY